MLPPPTLSFTIPSIHDNLVLECRVYHPTCLALTTVATISEWRKKVAIVAHPYAPLGGCYDDPVVGLVASTILRNGFIVGTFNFRGAGSSKGRTSWSSKQEQQDYISFVGFMIYYLYHLQPPKPPVYGLRSPKFTVSDPEFHDLSPIPSRAITSPQSVDTNCTTPTLSNPYSSLEKELRESTQLKPRLLLAGYSYGALITSSLPPIISSLIEPFQTPAPGSAYAEIRLRADCLADQQNSLMKLRVHSLLSQQNRGQSLEDHILHSPKLRGGNVRMGGEEDLHRASHETHHSRSSFTIDTPERVRKSVDRIRSMGKYGIHPTRRTSSRGSITSVASYKKRGNDSPYSAENVTVLDGTSDKEAIKAIPGICNDLQAAYLLISPLQGWVNSLATMWSSHSGRQQDLSEHDMKLTVDPTLALFGDDDVFVSVKKLRSWVERLASVKQKGKECQFGYKEISGAGHFWHNHEAIQTLHQEVKEFICTL